MEENVNMRGVRGDVKITLLHRDGTKKVYNYKNLIVNTGFTDFAKLLGGDAAGEKIDKIAFGTGTTAASITDTSLAAQVLTKAATVTYPAYNQVMFSATMGTSEGGSNVFAEIGLLTATSSILVSRIILSPTITKSTAYQIQIDWILSFQRS